MSTPASSGTVADSPLQALEQGLQAQSSRSRTERTLADKFWDIVLGDLPPVRRPRPRVVAVEEVPVQREEWPDEDAIGAEAGAQAEIWEELGFADSAAPTAAPSATTASASPLSPPGQTAPANDNVPEGGAAPAEAESAKEAKPVQDTAVRASVAGKQLSPVRFFEPNQHLTVLAKVASGKNVPQGLTGSSTCVEVRYCSGTEKLPMDTVVENPLQTQAVQGDMPTWDEILKVRDAVCATSTKDADVAGQLHFVLWDVRYIGNNAIGEGTVSLSNIIDLKQDSYSPDGTLEEAITKEQKVKIKGPDCSDCSISVIFGVWEMQKINLEVVKGTKLPIMDTLGTCDAFVEVRLVSGDQRRQPFQKTPGPETLWQGQTEVVKNSQEAKWKQKFEFISMGDPEANLLIILWDDDSPMPASVIGVGTLSLREIITDPVNTPEQHKIKFIPPPGEEKVQDLKKTSVTLSVSWDRVMAP